jgi:predicted Zn-dependent protease
VPRFLATLQRVDSLTEDGVPNWLSTHPDPGSRVERAEPVAAKFASASATARNREQYLERIDGLVYGDNPRDGIVRGHVFLHPVLRIGLDFPEGWEVMNSEQQVMAREPGTSHYMVLQEVEQPRGRSVQNLALDAMRRAGYQPVDGSLETINGLSAYVGTYRGSVRSVGRVIMRAAHIGVGRQVYVVAGFAPEKEFGVVDRDVSSSVRSFRELSRDEAARIRPNKVTFYVVRNGDSWQSIAARQGRGIVNAATLAIMNDHAVNEQPQPGERIKIVVEG